MNKVVYCEADGLDKRQHCDIYKRLFYFLFITLGGEEEMSLVPLLF